MDLTGGIAGDRGPGTGQIAKLEDWIGRDERAPHQAMGPKISKPRCIGHIGLGAGEVLDVTGVDQHGLKRAVLEQMIEELPSMRRLSAFGLAMGGC